MTAVLTVSRFRARVDDLFRGEGIACPGGEGRSDTWRTQRGTSRSPGQRSRPPPTAPALGRRARERPGSALLGSTSRALLTRRPRLVPLGGVAVAELLLVGEEVAAQVEGLSAGDAAKGDRRAETRLAAVVVQQAPVVVEVALRS